MRALLRNRKVQILLNGGLGLGLLAVSFFSAKHFVKGGWPLHHADPILVVAAAVLFLIAYAFKAWGWQRLFAPDDRPTAGALAFAGGAACVGGVAMPGRVDDAIRIACVKRFPGTRAGLGTIGLSLLILGMLDNAALAPLASIAFAFNADLLADGPGFVMVPALGTEKTAAVARGRTATFHWGAINIANGSATPLAGTPPSFTAGPVARGVAGRRDSRAAVGAECDAPPRRAEQTDRPPAGRGCRPARGGQSG